MKFVKTWPLAGVALGALAATVFAAPAFADPDLPPPPLPAEDTTIQTAADAPAAPPTEGVPHLYSPDNPPPGTSATPLGPGQPRTLEYLRDLWHAVQTQEVSGRDALLLFTQRPLNPDATPPPGLAPGPQQPVAATP